MRVGSGADVLARGYGLVLGLALGAVLWSTPLPWREAMAATAWMGAIEVGPSSASPTANLADGSPLDASR